MQNKLPLSYYLALLVEYEQRGLDTWELPVQILYPFSSSRAI